MIDLKTIPKLPQRQDSIEDQLLDIIAVANKLGMYDAADVINNLLQEREKRNVLYLTFKELSTMSKEQFEKELNKHQNGDIAKSLFYGWIGKKQ